MKSRLGRNLTQKAIRLNGISTHKVPSTARWNVVGRSVKKALLSSLRGGSASRVGRDIMPSAASSPQAVANEHRPTLQHRLTAGTSCIRMLLVTDRVHRISSIAR